jgi:WD40 repeat protein
MIASGGGDNIVQVWNALNRSSLPGYSVYTESKPVASIAWSQNGQTIVSGGRNDEVQA